MDELFLIDTDIMIDAGRGVDEAVEYLRNAERDFRLAASVVTQMELFVGCRNKSELRQVEKFLERFQVLRLTEEISDAAVGLLRRYRLSHGLLVADALIAATSMVFAVPFASKNHRDYRFIEGLDLRPYP